MQAEEVVVGLGHRLGRPVLVDGADLELLEVAAVGVGAAASRAAWSVVDGVGHRRSWLADPDAPIRCAAMRNPRDFFKPLGRRRARPAAARSRSPPSRMIHFFDPSQREDGRQAARHRARRPTSCSATSRTRSRPTARRPRARGSSRSAARPTSATTALWTRVNALESPWVLDDLTTLVGEIGDRLDVIMVPKVEGAVGHPLRRPPARPARGAAGLERPILVHAILETALGVDQPRGDRGRLPAHAGHELRPGRPRRLAADEDDARRRRPPRLPRARRPRPGDETRRARRAQQDLWHYSIARMVDACAATGILPFYGPFGDIKDVEGCEAQFRAAFLMGCVGAWSLHPVQIDIAKRVFSPDPDEVAFAKKVHRGDPRRPRRAHDRRQDAGRRDLEAVPGHGRPGRDARGEGPGARAAYGFSRSVRPAPRSWRPP